jgi:hypothetical protein
LLTDRLRSTAQSIKPDTEDAVPWEISGTDLRNLVVAEFHDSGQKSSASCKVIVDATYKRKDAVLLEIKHVWGYAYCWWTPLLLRMSEVASGENRPNGPSTPLEFFSLVTPSSNDFVHEFLYLQCGHTEGKPSWGRVGYTNAVLLYSDALEYFLGKIGLVRGAGS